MVLILIGFALIALIDLFPLIRQRSGRAIVAFAIVFTVALTLSVLQILNIEVPSAMMLWGSMLKSFGLSYPS